MPSIWLIGACPSKPSGLPLHPEGGRTSTADRLRVMLSMSVEEYAQSFRRANILDSPPWDAHRARVHGQRLRRAVRGRALVLGRDAWTALGLPDWSQWFETHECFTLIPHPSGRNLFYNDRENRETLRRVVGCALRRSG